jgi:hypothetical protein
MRSRIIISRRSCNPIWLKTPILTFNTPEVEKNHTHNNFSYSVLLKTATGNAKTKKENCYNFGACLKFMLENKELEWPIKPQLPAWLSCISQASHLEEVA